MRNQHHWKNHLSFDSSRGNEHNSLKFRWQQVEVGHFCDWMRSVLREEDFRHVSMLAVFTMSNVQLKTMYGLEELLHDGMMDGCQVERELNGISNRTMAQARLSGLGERSGFVILREE